MAKIQSPFRKLYNSLNGKTPIKAAEIMHELKNTSGFIPMYLFDSENENMARVTGFAWDPDTKAFEVKTTETFGPARQLAVYQAHNIIDSTVKSTDPYVLDSPILDESGNSVVDAYALEDAFLLVSAW